MTRRFRHHYRLAFGIGALALTALSTANTAEAATIDTNGASGNWTDTAIWTGGAVPGTGDSAELNDSGSFITIDSNIMPVDFVRIFNGVSVDLAAGGVLNTTNLRVGWFGPSTITRSGGLLNVTNNVDLGDGSSMTLVDGDMIGGELLVGVGGITTEAGSTVNVGTLLLGFFGAAPITRGADSTLIMEELRIRDNTVFIAASGDVVNDELRFQGSNGGTLQSAVSTTDGMGITLEGNTGGTINFHDSDDFIELIFTDPTSFVSGNYWAFRWAGSHSTYLNGLLGDELIIDDSSFNTTLYGTPTVFEEDGYTYVGVQNLVPEPASALLFSIGGLLLAQRRRG